MRTGPERDEAGAGAWRLLFALAALNTLSFIDRQLVVTLAPLLMADLHLTRAQIGLLVGPAFAVTFGLLNLFLGVAADRLSRRRMITAGLAVWSSVTALTGAALGFGQMLFLRLWVGVGEGVLSPTALSMLRDAFPPARLALANGIFYAGIPLGFALSFLLAAGLGPRLGWRACFLALGLLGVVGVAGTLALPDPPRRGAGPAVRPREMSAAARSTFASQPALALIVLGGAALAFMSSASQHVITWLVQERGFPFGRAALLSGAMVALGGLFGSLAIGAFTDRWRRRGAGGRLGALLLVGGAGIPCAAAFYLLPPSSSLFLPCWFLTQAFLLGWFGPVTAEIVERAPADLSATVAGVALLATNLLGVALGPWITGVIGDRASLTAGLLASLGVGVLGLAMLGLAGARGRAGQPLP